MRKFNQFKGYKGKYKGKLLTPMQYCQFGKPKDFIMSNRTHYKTFCQFDHMEQDKDFMGYLCRFVSTNPRTGNGIEENITFKHLYNKLKYITLNDIYIPNEEDSEIGCCAGGNKLTDWELEKIQHILKDYINFNKNRKEILEELYNEDRQYEDEMDYQEDMDAFNPEDGEQWDDEYLTKDLFTEEYLKNSVVSDDELPF